MSRNCGWYDDKATATGWCRFVPVIGGAAVVAALVAAAVFTNYGTTAAPKDSSRATVAAP